MTPNIFLSGTESNNNLLGLVLALRDKLMLNDGISRIAEVGLSKKSLEKEAKACCFVLFVFFLGIQ
jgi:hypothetical protein